MRITKLHLLLFFLLAGIGVYAAYFLHEKPAEIKPVMDAVPAPETASMPAAPQTAAPSAPAASAPVQTKVSSDPSKPVVYVVKGGETLWKIAKMPEHFGKGHRWYDIWKANENTLQDFDHLVRGQELVIPLDKPDGYKWPKTDDARKAKILAQVRVKAQKIPATN